MVTEIQNDFAEIYFDKESYMKCTGMERQRIDTIIERRTIEESKQLRS